MALLGGILTGLLGDGATPVQNAGILPTLPGISLPGITIPGFPTLSFPGLPTDSATSLSASVTSSAPLSLSTSSAPLSTSSDPGTTSSVAPTSTTTTSPTQDQDQTSSGHTQTVSNVVVVTNAVTDGNSAPSHHQSFLENKALSGTVFALVGLVALVLIIVIATFFVRRRRRSRLLDDALSFDPALLPAADRLDGSEKGHSNNPSLGTTGGGGYSTYSAYTASPAPPQHYGQQPDYYSQQADYYGGAPRANYGYVPPMADTGNSWGQPQQPTVPQQQHNIPRVPVPPQPAPLPREFGSSDESADRRRSAEETEFWARTLKVVNE